MLKCAPERHPKCPLVFHIQKVRRHLSVIDSNFIDSVWHYGLGADREHVGMEHLGLGSVKLGLSGVRRVLCLDFGQLLKFCRAGAAKGATVTMGHVQNVLKTADAHVVQALCTAKVNMSAADLQPGEALLVPQGYIVCEKTLNGQDHWGVRWTPMCQTVTESFADAVSMLLPTDLSKISSNSTMSLTLKFLQALKKTVNQEQALILSARFKADAWTSKKPDAAAAATAALKKEEPFGGAVKEEPAGAPPAKKAKTQSS